MIIMIVLPSLNCICNDEVSNFYHDNNTIRLQGFIFDFLNDINILVILLIPLIGINDISDYNVICCVQSNAFLDHHITQYI